MKQGLIIERKGKLFPYKFYQGALFGFNNFYGATVRAAVGGTDPTAVGDDPKNDIIELNVVGIKIKPEDLRSMYLNLVPCMYDKISKEDHAAVMEKIAAERPEPEMKGVDPIKKYNKDKGVFECLNNKEVTKIMRDLLEMPQRTAVSKPKLKIKYSIHSDKRSIYFPE